MKVTLTLMYFSLDFGLTEDGFECQDCPDNCKRCSDATTCITCHYGYALKAADKSCVACPKGCEGECDENSGVGECKCKTGDVEVTDTIFGKICVSNDCKTKLDTENIAVLGRLSSGIYGCVDCPPECETCEWNTIAKNVGCTTCSHGAIVASGRCIYTEAECALGYGLFTVAAGDNYCVECPLGCKDCFTDSDGLISCTECLEGLTKSEADSSCVINADIQTDCGPGKY